MQTILVPSASDVKPAFADLSAWIDAQARVYTLFGHDAGELVAHALRDLAAEVRTLHARTPDEVWDRRATLDALYAD
jgi:uroporphyrinogen-III synthase